MAYTDQEINDFLDMAQEVGITKTMRELKYPNSWSTAKRWAELRGVTVAVDTLKQQAAAVREWYKDEEVTLVAQEGFNRVYEELTTNPALTPDDQKKLAEALQKHYHVWAGIQGKATSITENRQTDTMDQHLQELLNMERSKNMDKIKENVSDN